eukprot:3318628-Amphidinium_carterae.1
MVQGWHLPVCRPHNLVHCNDLTICGRIDFTNCLDTLQGHQGLLRLGEKGHKDNQALLTLAL